VHDVRNRVDKLHDVLLEHFRRVRELADVAEPENGRDAPPGHQRVQVAAGPHIVADDFGAGVAKADGEEVADFGEGDLEDARLHQPVAVRGVALFESGAARAQGIRRQRAHAQQHALQGPRDAARRVALQEVDADGDGEHYERAAGQVEHGGHLEEGEGRREGGGLGGANAAAAKKRALLLPRSSSPPPSLTCEFQRTSSTADVTRQTPPAATARGSHAAPRAESAASSCGRRAAITPPSSVSVALHATRRSTADVGRPKRR
jgi:hypothetical protein